MLGFFCQQYAQNHLANTLISNKFDFFYTLCKFFLETRVKLLCCFRLYALRRSFWTFLNFVALQNFYGGQIDSVVEEICLQVSGSRPSFTMLSDKVQILTLSFPRLFVKKNRQLNVFFTKTLLFQQITNNTYNVRRCNGDGHELLWVSVWSEAFAQAYRRRIY